MDLFGKRTKFVPTIILLLLSSALLSAFAQKDVYSAAWALKGLLRNYGKQASIYFLEKELAGSEQSSLDEKLVEIARRRGLYLNKFRLKYKEELIKIDQPFISRFPQGYGLVRVKEGRVEIAFNRGRKELSLEEFQKSWSGELFSLPLVNIFLERDFHHNDNPSGRIVFIYSYHKEDFPAFQKVFDRLYQEAKQNNLRLIYVDELGLIPKDSLAKLENEELSEKEAFLRARKSLLQELKLIEKGVGIYDPTKFYYQIYEYLAKFKIEVEMENLRYENWKAIVAFDELELNQLAVKLFCQGKIERYLETLAQYNQGFWQYNVIIRDRFFRQQLEALALKNSNSLIVTLRGLGHFGMEEDLRVSGFSVESLIIGEDGFLNLLVPDQLLQILKRNRVRVDRKTERMFYLRAFPVECVRSYLQKKRNLKISQATLQANRILANLQEEDVRRLSLDLSHMIAEGRLRSTDKIYEYVFLWAKRKGWVEEE